MEAGPSCTCKFGYAGNVSWSADIVSGKCVKEKLRPKDLKKLQALLLKKFGAEGKGPPPIDKDGDGKICPDELREAVGHLKLDKEEAKQLADEFLKTYDIDGECVELSVVTGWLEKGVEKKSRAPRATPQVEQGALFFVSLLFCRVVLEL